MKKLKRIISLILTVAMMSTFAPGALAINDDMTSNMTTTSSDMADRENPESTTEGHGTIDEGSDGEEEADSTPPQEDTDGPEENNLPDGSKDGTQSGISDETDTDEISDADVPKDPVTPPENTILTLENTDGEVQSDSMPIAGGSITYYIANSSAGGSDKNGDGTEQNPYLTIGHAMDEAQAQDADDLQMVLLSDIASTLELVFDDPDLPVTITSANGTQTIQYTGTGAIGTESGFIKAVSGAQLAFDGVELAGSTGAYDGRVLYIAEGAQVTLSNTTVTAGRVNNVLTNEGGAGAFVDDQGILYIDDGTVFEGNETVAGGGALFVADGGTATISGDAAIRNNAAKLGGGVYADMQTNAYGGLTIADNVQITENDASENGSGMYVCAGANASVEGDVQITGNEKGNTENNVYLPEDATLDISGSTTGANIGISADPEYAYRLVSLPYNYTIQPTVSGDEKGWSDDCGTWDVRHMTYQGVEGLYLYYKTLYSF